MTERSYLHESTTQKLIASDYCSSQSLMLGWTGISLQFSCELLYGMGLVYERLQYANIMKIIYSMHRM